MQMNASYLVTDPKGALIGSTAWMFQAVGYRIRKFDLVRMETSSHYNPLAYVRTDIDVLAIVECLITNTTGDVEHTGDPFWENAERLLYTVLIAYLIHHCLPEGLSLPGMLTLLSLAEACEGNESHMSPLDLLFRELETGKRLVSAKDEQPFDESSRAFAAMVVILTTLLVLARNACADITGDINNWLVELLRDAANWMFLKQAEVLKGIGCDGILGADFNSMLTTSGSVSMYGIAHGVWKVAILPIGCGVLSLVFTVKLIQISQRVDGNAYMPGVKEVVFLLVFFAVFLFLIQHTFELMQSITEEPLGMVSRGSRSSSEGRDGGWLLDELRMAGWAILL